MFIARCPQDHLTRFGGAEINFAELVQLWFRSSKPRHAFYHSEAINMSLLRSKESIWEVSGYQLSLSGSPN